ncbi:hypothetical protein DENSPDRAFT_511437 [Dentipellis sp. KUC8613]|nr:hypothetical protein DENSPDRAFT_511437 [Dentipellis sp. KUC8613]
MLRRGYKPIAFALAAWCCARLPTAHAQSFSDDQISLVKQRLAEGATHSWEFGTRAQTLLELEAPDFSVLTHVSLPPPSSLNSSESSSLSDVFGIARTIVSGRAKSNHNATGPQPLIEDSSAGDPCSIGAAVLLANWTGQGAADGLDYAGAARDQLDYLWGNVPRTDDGALSHRVSQVQLWSDSVYMVPPFLAYYGVLSQNRSMVEEAYNQIKVYRNYLNDPNANGLWKHILLGNGTDEGHWSTGNGWAAAGMLRVLGTMQNSQYAKSFKNEMNDLANWAFQIQGGMYRNLVRPASLPFTPILSSTFRGPILTRLQQSNNLFKNYADSSDSGNFDDASSTAIMAATVYRLSLLANKHTYLPDAERSRKALATLLGSSSSSAAANRRAAPESDSTSAPDSRSGSSTSESRSSARPSATSPTSDSSSAPPSSSSSSSSSTTPTPTSTVFNGAAHFTEDGWLQPVVNPDSYGAQGQHSPESEAFVLQMQAAYQDWVAAGSKGANGAPRAAGGVGWAGWGVVLAGVVAGLAS